MGEYIEVHPTFLYESVLTLAIFILLTIKTNKRKHKGEITLIYLISYSIIRFLIEGLRTDSLMLGNVRVSQALSLIILFISGMLYLKKKQKGTDPICSE